MELAIFPVEIYTEPFAVFNETNTSLNGSLYRGDVYSIQDYLTARSFAFLSFSSLSFLLALSFLAFYEDNKKKHRINIQLHFQVRIS